MALDDLRRGRVVRVGQHDPDFLDRQVEPAQVRDEPCDAGLVAGVASVAGVWIGLCRLQECDIVVVPQGMDGQAGEVGESADRYQFVVIHEIRLTARVTRESTPGSRVPSVGSQLVALV